MFTPSPPDVTTGPLDTATVGVVGFRCAVCDASVGIDQPLVFRCPNWTAEDPHHSLRIVQRDALVQPVFESANPFLAYRPYSAWDSFAAAVGLTEPTRWGLVRELDAQIAAVDGTGFVVTPFHRANTMSDALGFVSFGGVWIKDETHQVAGSHKARHLFSTLLYLRSVEIAGLAPWGTGPAGRPPLAIASCGNAALAAATLARAADWPIHVFVPPVADPFVMARLGELGATITVCPRRDLDPAGDPCVLRYREAIAAGALPFSVQGPENVWCLDGGRTIGWEMALSLAVDHLFVQVGGGALARCTIGGYSQVGGPLPKLRAVQAEGCAPLARAWKRAAVGEGGVKAAAKHWSEYMTPWDTVPQSAADGILDDETYDWLGVVSGMAASHGAPVIATESEIIAAGELGLRTTTIDASITGTAGLAGLLAIRDTVSNHEKVAMIFSGARR
ncbi:MAG: PLP-dependent lyase/thiolase [Ilumatobacteraceae bacterium]